MSEAEQLYRQLLSAWDRRDARAFAQLFQAEGILIGFDGSQMQGPEQIEKELAEIFASHPTATFVAKVKSEKRLGQGAAHLMAIAGMVPRGGFDINPNVNAIQSLIAERVGPEWKISLLQNTPAAFHGRPQLVAQMSQELRAVLRG